MTNNRNIKSNKRNYKRKTQNYDYDRYDSDDYEYDYELEEEQKVASRKKSQTKSKNSKKRKKKKKVRLGRLLAVNLLLLTILCCLVFLTPPGRKAVINMAGNYIYGNFKYQPTKNTMKNEGGADNQPVRLDNPKLVMNFLLIGVEEIKGARNTDAMIIATLDTRNKSLKLTSLMRDLYIEIPGHDKNRLNAAYSKGGIELLYQTISHNFGIEIDGYCMVNFEAFEQIIDIIGGIEITLTEKEAKYLQTTNYISKKENRNVVAGKQLMNGNQVLGYCRIRRVSTGTESYDFGRTQRQRIVLQQIYNKLKSKNIVSLVMLMNKILNQVEIKTDITNETFNYCLEKAVNLKVKEIETMRIPKDGSYENTSVKIGKVKANVLVIKDMDATRKQLKEFIYGAENN